MSLRKDIRYLWELPATVARAGDALATATQGAIVEMCTCPKLTNGDNPANSYVLPDGTPLTVYIARCPVHGSKEKGK